MGRGLGVPGPLWLAVPSPNSSFPSVTLDLLRSSQSGVGRAEVGSVAAEVVDPLLPGILHRLGDQVRDIAIAAAGHADVRRGCAGLVADQHVPHGDVELWAP